LYYDASIKNKLTFLGYWSIKHDTSVILRLTLRERNGATFALKDIIIKLAKTYEIDIFNFFNIYTPTQSGFIYTLEVEIFSETQPMFTYPAMVLMYESNLGISAVHSCIRTYNENEILNDYAIGLPQTGFDLLLNKANRNYINFIGGKFSQYHLKITLIYKNGDFISKEIDIKQSPYSLHTIFIEEIFGSNLIEGKSRLIIEHNLEDVYPRFYCGYITNTELPTLTHSFFDTSEKFVNSVRNNITTLRVINNRKKIYYDSVFAVPIFPINNFNTELVSYDSNLKFTGKIIFEIRELDGTLIAMTIKNTASDNTLQGFTCLSIENLLNEMGLKLENPCTLFVKFLSTKSSFPTRFKLGLNIYKKIEASVGTNICFGSTTFNEAIISKPFSRRWLPIGGEKNFIAWIHNTTLEIKTNIIKNLCEIDIYNTDGEKYSIIQLIEKNQTIQINVKNYPKIDLFLNGKIGWAFIKMDTNFFDAYYISNIGIQIGGDHAF
jgi:hypothetical protein